MQRQSWTYNWKKKMISPPLLKQRNFQIYTVHFVCSIRVSHSLATLYIRNSYFQPQLENFVLAIFLTRLTVQSDSVLVHLLDDFLALFLCFFLLSFEACHLLVDSICCFLHWWHLLIGYLKIRLCITPAGQIVVMRESLRVMVMSLMPLTEDTQRLI